MADLGAAQPSMAKKALPPRLSYGLNTTPAPPFCGERLTLTLDVSNTLDQLVEITEITVTLVVGPFGDALTADPSGLKLNPPADWDMRQNGATFHLTPKDTTGHPGRVGAKGLEFDIGNILVSDETGPTCITVTEHSGTDTPRIGTLQTELTKENPPLHLGNVVVDTPTFDYMGEVTLSWQATHGAVIEISWPGQSVRSVKSQPGTPLPAKGDFTLEELSEDTVVTVIATGQKADGSADKQEKQITLGMNPAVLADVATITTKTETGLPAVQFKCTPKSAQSVTVAGPGLSPTKIDIDPSVLDADGALIWPQTPIPRLLPTDYTLTPENPGTLDPEGYTAPYSPPTDTWIYVGPSPNISRSAITATADRLVTIQYQDIDADGAPDTGRVSSSRDGLTWTTHKTPAPWTATFDDNFYSNRIAQISTFAHGARVFICASLFTPKMTLALWYSDDLETWVQAPPLDLPQPEDGAILGNMCADEQGHVWAACYTFADAQSFPKTAQLFKTEDLKTWTPMPTLDDGTSNSQYDVTAMDWIGGRLVICLSAPGELGRVKTDVYTAGADGVMTKAPGAPMSGRPGARLVSAGADLAAVFDTADPDHALYQLTLTRRTPDGTNTVDTPQADIARMGGNSLFPTVQITTFNGAIFADTVATMDGWTNGHQDPNHARNGIWMFCPASASD
ncbi:hypothetical protein [uncultured Tateyamaria sp.]|uniref:hypothetical protein n=1 Tax=uncultured Tateyamaria sp. TaxID=455651 RepID=UPI0026065EA2|nr:hypothetical protein [uncultured Tateyamaria sp.]